MLLAVPDTELITEEQAQELGVPILNSVTARRIKVDAADKSKYKKASRIAVDGRQQKAMLEARGLPQLEPGEQSHKAT